MVNNGYDIALLVTIKGVNRYEIKAQKLVFTTDFVKNPSLKYNPALRGLPRWTAMNI